MYIKRILVSSRENLKAERKMANSIHEKLKIGTIGELLVQYENNLLPL